MVIDEFRDVGLIAERERFATASNDRLTSE